jgi:hypothetical protein
MTLDCQDIEFQGPGENRMTMVPPFNLEEYKLVLEERRKACDGKSHMMGMMKTWVTQESLENGTKLDPGLDVQSVMVNLSM